MVGVFDCVIQVDGHDLFSAKSVIPDHFISLFQESDHRKTQDPEREVPDVTYVASRAAILERLDLLVCKRCSDPT